MLKIFFSTFLDQRAEGMPDVLEARDLSADILKEYAVWLVARRRFKRRTAATMYSICACFLRRAKRAFPAEFDPAFRTPKHLFDGADAESGESRALSVAEFKKILTAAERDVKQIRSTYKDDRTLRMSESIV